MITAVAFAAFVVACPEHDAATTAQSLSKEPAAVSVDELASLQAKSVKEKKALFVFDANRPETRADKGVIPGAVLLPSSETYDLALLPKDKGAPAVFYCANERCSASTKAAKRALDAGYTNVKVLPQGIFGWVKAGKAVTKQPQA